jgi:hypothetical protein
VKADGSHNDFGGFSRIGSIMPEVLKEVSHRCELRARLEVELGRELTDEKFLAIAEAGGIKI